MNTKTYLSFLRATGFSLALVALPLQAGASTIYLSFSANNNASGTLAGSPFSNASWTLEYQIDTATVDGSATAETGLFYGAITGGHITVNANTYNLVGTSATGNVVLQHFPNPDFSDRVIVNPTSGGYIQFLTNYGATFPALFSNVNDLNTAISGTTLTDTTTDLFNNYSILNMQLDQQLNPVIHSSGGDISIFAYDAPAGGNFSVTVSNVSTVPLPGSLLLFGSGALGLLGRVRRNKA